MSSSRLCQTVNRHRVSRLRAVLLLFLVVLGTRLCPAYSVLTHEEVVDLLWQDQIQPLLKKRFPDATEEDLRKAHAFAYGGCVIQDMGYYPFGSKYFSDLTHYVRSGDFVVNLIQESSDLNEFAFTLGALSHYAADNSGHPTINRVVTIEFPKLGKKYGERATYADDPKAHIRTEFGFDMVQVAKNRYTSDRYHDFIGFEVSKDLLDRAFVRTYGLHLSDVLGDTDLAIGTFRRAVSKVIPEMTRVALLARRQEIVRDTPNFAEKKFRYYLSRKSYEQEWGKGYRHPGLGTKILAFFLRLIPKKGPFSALAFKIPTTQTEDMYIKSVDLTVEDYAKLLRETRSQDMQLPNKDCDTGRDTRAGEYQLTDKAYERLLNQLAGRKFENVTLRLKENILEFYSDLNAPIRTKRSKKAWERTLANLELLHAAQASLPNPVKTTQDEAQAPVSADSE
ncbi:MAG TPA: zinc dependent phospholipase C family protein [Terriglobales bacterium]|nr:zinc dependent phospholipase C family protein [Terriglobales bacterium]